MQCPSVETLSDLLDNALPLKTRWQVKRHVRYCPACTRQLAAEAKLRKQAVSVAAEATAPTNLRIRVFDALPQPQAHASRRRAPMLLAAALCSVLVALTAWLLRPVVVPLPAFAQVVEAMRAIRTARWQVQFREYDARTGKTYNSGWTNSVRLNPPALATAYPRESHRKVLTPAMIKVAEGKSGDRIWTAPDFGFFSVENDPSATPSSVLKEHILSQIVAPRSPGGGSAAWKSRRETVNGHELLRFESKMGGKRPKDKAAPDFETSLLTVPGYRYRIWADPDTLRIVKTEAEYYDGQKHSHTTCTGFQYDLSLPDSEFHSR